MAKLPKVKKNIAQDDSDELEIVVTEEDTDESQTDALGDVMSKVTQTAESAGDTEDEQEEHGDEEPTSDEPETSEEEGEGENPETAPPAKEDTITVTPPKFSAPKPTTVKVCTVCDHSCYIGGVPYHFKRGVVTTVPAPVKEILRNAGLLSAL